MRPACDVSTIDACSVYPKPARRGGSLVTSDKLFPSYFFRESATTCDRPTMGQFRTLNAQHLRFHSFESADLFVDLLTEMASRMRAEASSLILGKSCRPFAARQRSNVKCFKIWPRSFPQTLIDILTAMDQVFDAADAARSLVSNRITIVI